MYLPNVLRVGKEEAVCLLVVKSQGLKGTNDPEGRGEKGQVRSVILGPADEWSCTENRAKSQERASMKWGERVRVHE